MNKTCCNRGDGDVQKLKEIEMNERENPPTLEAAEQEPLSPVSES